MNLVQCGLLKSNNGSALIYGDPATADLHLKVYDKYLLFTELPGYNPIATNVEALEKLIDYLSVEGVILTEQYIIALEGNNATFLDYNYNKVRIVIYDFLET